LTIAKRTVALSSTGLATPTARPSTSLGYQPALAATKRDEIKASTGVIMRVAVTVEQSWHVVPGGIATSTVELLRALAGHDDLQVVGVAARHREPPPRALVPPVPVRQLPLPRRLLYETWQWLRWPPVERATGPLDVLHDAGFVVPPSRAPLVATIHDLFFLTHPSHYRWHPRMVLRRGFDLARRHARLVMCPSRATMVECVAAGMEPERLRVVPWGVRMREVSADRAADVRHRYGLARPYVFFCGTVEPRKNLPRLLEAFRALDRPDVELILAGQQGWKEDIRTLLGRLPGRARWLGLVPKDDLDALYRDAAVVVYPSLREGFGLPVLEAMAQGAAVVTSAGTATEEVAGDAAVLVDPLNVEAIAGAMARLLDDRELAASLGKAARKRARTFDWSRTAELTAGVYAEAAGHAS
jgi:glycosyltransferase involved in cell wall biosynthesis